MLQYIPSDMLPRILASLESESYKIDYNVLSVAAMTLAMIMMVEYMRHLLDHQAEHRPFFRVVLEGVYAELATLGIVEFFLHLIEEYYPSYDKTRKSVFADVHFLFFYTAILNALFSVGTAILVVRASKKEWIQTESLELNHYVEIRETFSRVEKEIEEVRTKRKQRLRRRRSESYLNNSKTQQSLPPEDPERGNAQSLNSSSEKDMWVFQNWDQMWTSLVDQLRYPALNHQYYLLLKQIRFHELRVHIIQSYNLPNQIKISDYLMRSEQVVLMKLVNVSSLAWLLLTGAVCVLYYVCGMVFYKFENQELIGIALTYIYFFWMGSFVVVCWMLSIKMKSIFNALMHSEELWDVHSSNVENKEALAQKQLALFWYRQPSLVVKLIQFMQFGYATSLSTLIVFWKDIRDGSVSMVWFAFSLIFCYTLFVFVTVQALPRFTLCTNLGQLVDEHRLRETLALYRLEEAKQKEFERLENLLPWQNNVDGVVEHATSHLPEHDAVEMNDLNSELSVALRHSEPDVLQTKKMEKSSQLISNGDRMAELVKIETVALRTSLEVNEQSEGNSLIRSNSESLHDEEDLVDGVKLHQKQDDHMRSLSDDALALRDTSGSTVAHSFSRPIENTSSPTATGDAKFGNAHKNLAPVDDDCRSVDDDGPFLEALKHVVPNAKKYSQTQTSCVMKWLRSYFFSERHIEISNVFGAIVAFFFVGHRVEGFIHSQKIYLYGFVSFNFELEYTFWMLTAWLCMFLFASMLIVLLLGCYGDLKTTKGYRIAVAASIDAMISSVCLTVLFIAEYKRCCDAAGLNEETDKAGRASFLDPEPESCNCPRFGTRLYGGLGTIEPYTSLVLLRVLRHWLARKLLDFLQLKYGFPKLEAEKDPKRTHKTGAATSGSQVLKFGARSWDAMNSSLAVAEVWEATIGSYPDVAAAHGEFSSEILRIMLGVSTPQSMVLQSGNGFVENISDSKGNQKEDQASSSDSLQTFSLDRQYASLSSVAQAVILAGKLGRSIVPSTSQPNIQSSSSGFRPTPLSRGQSVMFKIDNNDSSVMYQNDTTNSDGLSHNFVSPNARLIRSMRRCDRKLLPLLESWTEVDVVVTRFEIVYLEVVNEENNSDSRFNGVLQALQATKGGKGLRLCDAVAGRLVAGRVVLSDISSLHVVRHLTFQEDGFQLADTDNSTWEVGLEEYWRLSPPTIPSPNDPQTIEQSRSDAWNQFHEDHLTIRTIHGHSLVLRFYADLDDAIRHPEHYMTDEKVSVFKNNALQWVQTIGRFCGPEQLKQQLLHFGEGSSDELRDYLTIVDRSDSRRGPSHRRILSDTQGSSFRIGQSFRGMTRGGSRPNLLRRLSTMDTTRNTGQRGFVRPNLIRRMSSVDAVRRDFQRPPRRQFRSGPLHEDSGTL